MSIQHPSHESAGQRIALGLTVIGIGILALLDNLDVFGMPLLRTFWPLALVLFGLGRLVGHRQDGQRLFGAVLVLAGVVMTAHNLGLLQMRLRDWWPVFIILVGLSILMRGLLPRRRGGAAEALPATPAEGGRVDIDASFSEVRRRHESGPFKGGRIQASFGSVDLDLRQAVMEGPQAVLDIAGRFSGIKLAVPRDWQVVVEVRPTVGGVDDRSLPPADGSRRLLLRGELSFSNLEIHH